MIMIFAVFLFLAGFSVPARAGLATTANGYMDTVLNNTLPNATRSRSMDPASLPIFQSTFKDKVMMMNVKGHVNYTNGNLTGLSNATRVGQCSGPITVADKIMINCTISLEKLKIKYDGRLKYGKMPTVSISAKAKTTGTKIFVAAENHKKSSPHMSKFEFINAGELKDIKFTGLGSGLNKYMKILEDDFRLQTWRFIYEKLSVDLQNLLNQAFARTPFPW